MDSAETARAYRRRADAREAARRERHDALWQKVRQIANELREAFGPRIRLYAFGSLLDLDRFRGGSDIDLAVEGLEPAEYWEAWRIVESMVAGAPVDFVRLETADARLRESVRAEGRLLL